MTLLTVGLPVYNGLPYIKDSVDSLLQQTYTDFELFIVDDGSTDGTLEYLKTIKDRRVRVVCQENSGLTATLNRILRETNTPWLVRHDADDIALPHRLAVTADYINRFPDAGMFYSYARYWRNGKVFGTFRTTSATPEQLRALTAAGFLLAICHPAVTLNVEKTLAVGGYRFNLHVEDVDLWWRLALLFDLKLIPTPTVAVRHNTHSVSANNFERQCINTLYIQYLLLSHLWKLRPLSYEQVHLHLSALVNREHLRFRENARLANIALSRRSYLEAFTRTVSAFAASPGHLAKRLLYEVRPHSAVTNGEDPKRFRVKQDVLWPGMKIYSDVRADEPFAALSH